MSFVKWMNDIKHSILYHAIVTRLKVNFRRRGLQRLCFHARTNISWHALVQRRKCRSVLRVSSKWCQNISQRKSFSNETLKKSSVAHVLYSIFCYSKVVNCSSPFNRGKLQLNDYIIIFRWFLSTQKSKCTVGVLKFDHFNSSQIIQSAAIATII